ncbi:MAG: zinc-binding alcohol dehydrogenase [bacterium]|nr:zinc-binding alcohol dehydrogenase [bacterium]
MDAQRFICPDTRKIELETFDPGPVPANGILVKNDYTAVSVGTEVYGWIQGAEPGGKRSFPRTTGYCSTGTVLEVGSQVQHIQPGDRVAGQGNHASHAVLTRFYRKVPEGLSPRAAVFMVMAAIAIHGHRVARIELGEVVAIFGLGIVGQLAATYAKLSGATPVIGIDLDPFRIQKARDRGIDVCFNPKEVKDLREAILPHCVEDGVNVVIEATGKPAVYPAAVKLPCLAGRLVALGSPRGTVEMDFLADVHLREISILGAHQPKTPDQDHLYYRWSKDRDRDLVLRLMAAGKLPIEDLITHVSKPEPCQEIYTMLADHPKEVLGVVFDWT